MILILLPIVDLGMTLLMPGGNWNNGGFVESLEFPSILAGIWLKADY